MHGFLLIARNSKSPIAEAFESPPPFYSMYVYILSEQSEESIHTDNTYLNSIFQTSIQSA